ncbi:helix-turn-helix domain-containing protein [bacterium]|nr:MAG: helix-turn-helix domain-containing protein [bacterium]
MPAKITNNFVQARQQAILESSHKQTRRQLTQFGIRIRERRQTWSLSQKYVAQLAGTTQSVIAQIEAGQGNPSINLLLRITHALPGAQLELRLFNDYQNR